MVDGSLRPSFPMKRLLLQVSVECSLGMLSLTKGDRYGVGFPNGYNASNNTLFFIGLQVGAVFCFRATVTLFNRKNTTNFKSIRMSHPLGGFYGRLPFELLGAKMVPTGIAAYLTGGSKPMPNPLKQPPPLAGPVLCNVTRCDLT